jgi:hypothetical protein
LIGTLEAIFNKEMYTAFFSKPNLQAPAKLNVAGYTDNRVMYGASVPTRFINTLNSAGIPTAGGTSAFNPILITNGKKGFYFSMTAKVEKPFSKGFYASVAYTKSLAGNMHDGGGDQPQSAWQGTATINGANTSPLGYTDYVLPDRVVALVSYRKEYLKHLATTVSLIYNGAIWGRFSYVYGGDFSRDGVSGNDLIYIPSVAEVKNICNLPTRL